MKRKKISNLDLWVEFKNCDDKNKRNKLKNELIEKYYPFVVKIAYKVVKEIEWNLFPDELSSFGVDGLYDAIEKYDISRGIDFCQFSYLRIKGSMIDNIRKNDFVSRSVRSNQKKIEKAKDILLSEKGFNIKESDILKKADIDEEEYNKNIRKYKSFNIYSLDGSDTSSGSLDEYNKDSNDIFIDNRSKDPCDNILGKEFLFKLIGKNFSQLEQKIVYYYYYYNYTMEDIAKKFNMSESRICQIHKNILPRLQDKILRNPKYFEKEIKEFCKK